MAELVQLEADLAAKQAARIDGERVFFESRQDLGREIGLESGEIEALPLPAASFPAVEPGAVPPLAEDSDLISQAFERRADRRAAAKRLEASEILLGAAENGLKPQLDLILTPSYSGLTEGDGVGDFLSPVYRNVPGLSTSLGLSLSWPSRNRRAEGELIQAQAACLQSALDVDLFTRSIGAEVPTAHDAVRRNAFRVEKATAAVGLFEQAVENEEKKLRAGTSTLIDVISQRDRLTAASQREVSARLALALALLELRFQTGTLLAVGGEVGSIRAEDLTTLPF